MAVASPANKRDGHLARVDPLTPHPINRLTGGSVFGRVRNEVLSEVFIISG